MKHKRFVLNFAFGILFFSTNILFGQGINDNFWGGLRDDYLSDFTMQRPYLYLGGSSKSFDCFENEAYLSKVDTSGNEIWSIAYDYPANNILYTSDNKMILTGWSNITELDTNGSVVYSKILPINPNTIIQTYDKNFLLGGYNYTNLVKLDGDGNIIYSKIYRGGHGTINASPDGYSTINSIVETGDSGFIVTGYSAIDLMDFPFIVKSNKTGNIDWAKTYNRKIGLYSNGNIIDDDNKGYVICGNAEGVTSPWPNDPFILKVNSRGDVIWSKVYRMNTSSVSERKVRINKFLNNDFIISGTIGDYVFDDNTYYYAIRTDSLGNVKWARKYGNSKINICTSVLIDGNSILLGGYSNDYNQETNPSHDPYQTDIHIIRIDSSGNSVAHSENVVIDAYNYIDGTIDNSIKDSLIFSVTKDTSIVSRIVHSSDSLNCIETGINQHNINITFTVYPNPFSNKAIIKFENVENKNVSLRVFNCFGQLVKTVSNITNDLIEIERQNLVSGFYFIQAYNGNQLIGIRKILIE